VLNTGLLRDGGPADFEGFGAGVSFRESEVVEHTSDKEHLEIGPDMLPGIGFIRRTDIAKTSGSLRFTPRPPIKGLRKIDIRNSYDYVASVSTRDLLDRRWEIDISPELDSGDEASFEVVYEFQRLDREFPLDSGIVVPPGDYETWNFDLGISTSPARAVSVELGSLVGGFWGGDIWGAGAEIAFNSPHFGLELGYEHNDVNVPGGAFNTDLVRGRLKLAASTRLFGNALLQYNSQNGSFSANLRIDWIHRPGSDLFIVFNERRDVVGSRWNPESRAFIVKLTYLMWL